MSRAFFFELETILIECSSRSHTPCSDVAVAAFLVLVKKVPEDVSTGFPHLSREEHEMVILLLVYA